MTAREYAAECGVELVGKLIKNVEKHEKWNAYKGEIEIISTIYYTDEAGNEINGTRKGGWCLVTPDGTVY